MSWREIFKVYVVFWTEVYLSHLSSEHHTLLALLNILFFCFSCPLKRRLKWSLPMFKHLQISNGISNLQWGMFHSSIQEYFFHPCSSLCSPMYGSPCGPPSSLSAASPISWFIQCSSSLKHWMNKIPWPSSSLPSFTHQLYCLKNLVHEISVFSLLCKELRCCCSILKTRKTLKNSS